MLDQVVGQEKALGLLQADFESGRLAESYIFAGPEGVGKKFTALELAKALACMRSRRESLIPDRATSPIPCGECLSCRRIQERTHQWCL